MHLSSCSKKTNIVYKKFTYKYYICSHRLCTHNKYRNINIKIGRQTTDNVKIGGYLWTCIFLWQEYCFHVNIYFSLYTIYFVTYIYYIVNILTNCWISRCAWLFILPFGWTSDNEWTNESAKVGLIVNAAWWRYIYIYINVALLCVSYHICVLCEHGVRRQIEGIYIQ